MQEVSKFISNHMALSLAAIATLVLLTIIELLRLKRSTAQLTTTRLTQLINHDNAVVIDLRPNEAFKKGHIIDAQSIPGQALRDDPKKIEKFKARPMILICETGQESQKIAATLTKQGYNAHSLAGGLRAWRDAQLPLIKE